MLVKKITGVLFDLDGTLIDSAQDICNSANYVLSQRRKHLYLVDEIRPLIGLPAAEIFVRAGVSEQLDAAIFEFREHLGQTGGDPSTVYSGVHECLSNLQEMNLPLAIATNKPTELAMTVLQRANLLNYFSHVQGAEQLPAKPEPEILIHCAKMINSKIESTWMVGDSPVDIRASKSAGCTSIGVVYHEEFLKVLSSEKPDILVRSLSELKLSGSN